MLAASVADTLLIDLNENSLLYINTVGEEASHVYNLTPDDNTHLNDHGSTVFGRMVADLLLQTKPDLAPWFSDSLARGIPA